MFSLKPGIVLLLLIVAWSCRGDPAATAKRYIEAGDKHLAAGDARSAVIQYRNAVRAQPNSGEARAKLGEAYLENGDLRNAFRETQRAADLVPGDPGLQVKAGRMALLGGQFDDARSRAERALAADPKNVDAQVLRANALAELKDVDGAVRDIEKAILLDPKRAGTYSELGAIETRRGNLDEAEAAFKRAVETDPRSVGARVALAQFYWSRARLAEAEAEFKQAIAIAPKDELANRALSSFYLATGRTAEAEPYFKTVVENTKEVAPRFALAEFYVQQGRMPEAVALLEPLVGDPQFGGAATARLALIEYAAGKTGEAHKRLDTVLARDARNPHVNIAKGRFLLGENKVADALVRMKTAVETDPGLVEGHFWLGTALSANGQDVEALKAFNEALRINPRLAPAQVQAARLELAAGNAAVAVGLADSAVLADPNSREARTILARALLVTRDYRRADEQVKVLLEGATPSADLYTMQGMVLGGLGKRAEARAAFERAAALAPGSAEAISGLVALDLADKKPENARARVDRHLKATPDDPSLLMLGARLNIQLKDYAAAEPMLRKVLTLRPSQLQAYHLLGNLYLAQERHEEALREFEALSQRQPDNIVGSTMAGIILEMMGKPAEARLRYEAVVQRNPRAAVASNNLAWMYAETGGNLDVALQLAQSAKREMPQAGEVNDTLGYIYLRKNLPGLAVPLLRDATDKLPALPLVRYHLGLALLATGDKPGARRELEQALKLDPKFPGADEARRALSTLN